MTAAGRVLFVDDEPAILAALRNMLRKQRRDWDMVFADSGESALRELRAASFDVIVSDMRMPGMDGATLLRHVREEFPGVVRIILSGHSEREALLRALPVSHQVLSKPCEADVLKEVLAKSLALHGMLEDSGLRDAVGRIGRLPSVSRIYRDFTRAVDQPGVSPADLARIAERDPAIAAKLLQLVNSSCFRSPTPITSVEGALAHLGLDLVRRLAMTADAFGAIEGVATLAGLSLARHQAHGLLCARIARRLMEGRPEATDAYTAGLLHDVGEVVLALVAPDRMQDVMEQVREGSRPLFAVELEVLGVTHVEVGAYLLGLWGLPPSIVEAVRFHHQPSATSGAGLDLRAAVHMADALATVHGSCDIDAVSVDPAYLETLDLVAEVPRWAAIAQEESRGLRVTEAVPDTAKGLGGPKRVRMIA